MRVLVLLSGGVDSSTCLAMAVDRYGKDNVV
ncbi:MAG: 7-cyano-7-deazaguanine synthase, partial [Fusobacterium mortiferum]|nr:7-cyano-7-deazaguanine synthase [Fusobacterium mortiferum]